MKIGSVKEIKKYEYRVGLTPDNVKSMQDIRYILNATPESVLVL